MRTDDLLKYYMIVSEHSCVTVDSEDRHKDEGEDSYTGSMMRAFEIGGITAVINDAVKAVLDLIKITCAGIDVPELLDMYKQRHIDISISNGSEIDIDDSAILDLIIDVSNRANDSYVEYALNIIIKYAMELFDNAVKEIEAMVEGLDETMWEEMNEPCFALRSEPAMVI